MCNDVWYCLSSYLDFPFRGALFTFEFMNILYLSL